MKAARRGLRKGARSWAAALSAVLHGGLLAVMLLAAPQAPPVVAPRVVEVALVPPRPAPPPARAAEPDRPPGPPDDAPAASAPPVTPRPAPPARKVEAAAPIARPAPSVFADASGVSAAELAGAARAGGGGGAGGSGAGQCDMLERLEARLRRDARVRAAVGRALTDRADEGAAPAIRVWNGDWVRHPGEAGGGLAAVREAIIWEVGFAPDACRTQPVRGLVQIALGETDDGPRLVLGAGAWRWSDLLSARGRARS
ncbi:hypothetical protein [Phenylobacterium sp. SCN 70-31]|uniref:hypothetical protein n=1 Tax=Phenylobacterium sp. SCN 70-31 TaxID=1660129 RepID=UPI00086F4921|nr:hypothetical protein [Phenylobacterium sp. SCN 70-31]ODT86943.1 MAG: hypothetical protein ABS78_13835 [Phenylobacterium sp. SCN 70-31]